jgi:hypothetical protein
MVHPVDGIYKKDGIAYVSVSTVTSETLEEFHPGKFYSLAKWRAEEENAEEILARSQTRGTLIHAENELALLSDKTEVTRDRITYEDMVEYNIHEYMHYLHPFLDELKAQNPCLHQILVEHELYCRRGWAGTPDLRLWWEGHFTTFDYKSVRSYKEEGVKKKRKYRSNYTEAFVQIAAYSLAHNIENKDNPRLPQVTQGAVCVCYDWREPDIYLLNKEELRENSKEFLQRFKTYQEQSGLIFPHSI